MRDAVTIVVNGQRFSVPGGITVAAAILAAGGMQFRTSVSGEPRAPLCGMGICFECRATVNDIPYSRTCQTMVREGMTVRTR